MKKASEYSEMSDVNVYGAYTFEKPAKYLSYQRILRDFGLSLARN
jgi:hypothetical protein